MLFAHICLFNKSIQLFTSRIFLIDFYNLINPKKPNIEVVFGMFFNSVHFQTAHANNLDGEEENFQLQLNRAIISRDESTLSLNKMAEEKDRNLIDQLETVTRLDAVEMEFLAEISQSQNKMALALNKMAEEKDRNPIDQLETVTRLAAVEMEFMAKISPSQNKMALTLNKMAEEKDRNLIDQLEMVTRLAAVEMEFLAEIEKISREKVLQIQWDKEKDYLG